jgi:hypothetical protein
MLDFQAIPQIKLTLLIQPQEHTGLGTMQQGNEHAHQVYNYRGECKTYPAVLALEQVLFLDKGLDAYVSQLQAHD